MIKTAEELCFVIQSYFGKEPPPQVNLIVDNNSLEAQSVRDFFAGKSWWDISLGDLQNSYQGDGSACLTFMSAPGFIYYLPCYMEIVCKNFYEADAISAEFIPKLIRPIQDSAHKHHAALRTLESTQHRAIAEFLKFVSEHYLKHEAHDEAAEALGLFWADYLK
ncbi:hypothetical protein JCM19000A_22780 [Silvimonas sp. JCM 19000]